MAAEKDSGEQLDQHPALHRTPFTSNIPPPLAILI